MGSYFNLGVGYDKGDGVPQDYTDMAKWYRKAAEQGHAAAQHNLGCCYDEGVGVPKNHEEAMKWCRKAAGQGYAPAQDRLRAMGEFSTSSVRQASEGTCAELVKRFISLWGIPAVQGTSQSQKPGYDVLYLYPGYGPITIAKVFGTIGKPDTVHDKERNLAGTFQDWIYRCTDGEVCVEVVNSNRGWISIPNCSIHSRSR
jgi:hypothetical protein